MSEIQNRLDRMEIFDTMNLRVITGDIKHNNIHITKVFGGHVYHTTFKQTDNSKVITSVFVPRG